MTGGKRTSAKRARSARPRAAVRLVELDTFRGIGLLAVLVGLAVGDVAELPAALRPAEGSGFRAADLVAPWMVLASGMALRCAHDAQPNLQARGLRLAKRVLVLLAVAVGLAAVAARGWPTLHVSGFLPALAVAWGVAWGLLSAPRWAQAGAAGLLLGVAAWADGLTEGFVWGLVEVTVVATPGDLAVLPAVTVAVLAGAWFVAWVKARPRGAATTAATAVVGTYLLVIGLVAAQVVPVERTTWSTSFVLLGVGAAMVGFSAVHLLVVVLPLAPAVQHVTRLGRQALPAYVAVAALTAWFRAGEPGSTWSAVVDGVQAWLGDGPGLLLLVGLIVLGAIALAGALDREELRLSA